MIYSGDHVHYLVQATVKIISAKLPHMKGSQQTDTVELIEGSWISLKAFSHLADGAIKGKGWLHLMVSRLVETLFKPHPL